MCGSQNSISYNLGLLPNFTGKILEKIKCIPYSAGNSRAKSKGKSKRVKENVFETTKKKLEILILVNMILFIVKCDGDVKDLFGFKNYNFKRNEWGHFEVIYNDKAKPNALPRY
jgi:hypothetical protein